MKNETLEKLTKVGLPFIRDFPGVYSVYTKDLEPYGPCFETTKDFPSHVLISYGSEEMNWYNTKRKSFGFQFTGNYSFPTSQDDLTDKIFIELSKSSFCDTNIDLLDKVIERTYNMNEEKTSKARPAIELVREMFDKAFETKGEAGLREVWSLVTVLRNVDCSKNNNEDKIKKLFCNPIRHTVLSKSMAKIIGVSDSNSYSEKRLDEIVFSKEYSGLSQDNSHYCNHISALPVKVRIEKTSKECRIGDQLICCKSLSHQYKEFIFAEGAKVVVIEKIGGGLLLRDVTCFDSSTNEDFGIYFSNRIIDEHFKVSN